MLLNNPGRLFAAGPPQHRAVVPLTVSLPRPDRHDTVPATAPATIAAVTEAADEVVEKRPIREDSTTPPPPAEPATPPAVTGILDGPWYYPARYLHRRPSPLQPVRPEYPPEAAELSGHVVLLLLINSDGGVDQARIESATPPGIFDASVLAAFTRAKYAPGLITGTPVKSQLLVEVFFEPGQPPQANFMLRDTIIIPAPPAAGN